MSDQFFYLQLKFTPKIGHTFTDEREVFVEIPKKLVQRRSESVNESLKEVIALDLAKNAALSTFPTDVERVTVLDAFILANGDTGGDIHLDFDGRSGHGSSLNPRKGKVPAGSWSLSADLCPFCLFAKVCTYKRENRNSGAESGTV